MIGWALLTGFVLVPAAGWLAITIHELGHWLGGILVRFRTLIVVVWPFRVQRDGERLRVGTVWNLSFIGGMVACLPTEMHNLRRRMAVLTAGGPAASLVAGVLGLGIWWQFVRPLVGAGVPRAAGLLLMLFGAFSMLVGLSSLYPRETAGYRSDGARLRALRRGSATIDQEFAALALSSLSLTGVRPRDWEAGLVSRACVEGEDPLLNLTGEHLRWAWHLDRSEVSDADVAMRRLLNGIDRLPIEVGSTVLLDAAWFTAWHDGDPASARLHLERATSTLLTSPHERPLAEAAIALREGDVATAQVRIDDAERLLPKSMDRGQALVAGERIVAMREGARGEK
ncbi:MAG TPA: M50 family metallopeptidase [Gemmatimonadales bacterium]|nr:M50 family metallopeptidase [Gemmatimonadales bacterium]